VISDGKCTIRIHPSDRAFIHDEQNKEERALPWIWQLSVKVKSDLIKISGIFIFFLNNLPLYFYFLS
jgi:hypothetical protein